jgi:hypothetical protein
MKPLPFSFTTTPNANSNFAKYSPDKLIISCAWMDLHCDTHDTINSKSWYVIKIKYVHLNAAFVHKSNGYYEMVEFKAGSVYTFNQRKPHALLPRSLAIELCERQDARFDKYRKWRKKIDGNAFNAKCVWEFM